MKKKLVSLLLVSAMMIASFAGCKKDGDSGNKGGTLTIEIYDAAANFQGTQTGWFAKVVKDKFDIELNIIAPQVAGDSIYQTRASSGNLGDIIILDATDFADSVNAGLIKDISGDIGKYSNLQTFKKQIDSYNQGITDGGKIYGIPCQMVNTSPTSYSQDVVYSSPLLRWDLYAELGCPEIKDLNGLLDVLAQMKDKHPTNDAGDKCYPLSLWPDWDGGDGMLGIANVVQLTTWYGEKIKGSAILKPDNTFTKITDKNATYYKMLKFLNDAYLRGLVDPDSGTQNWDSACAKMSSGQVYLMWYSWQVGFWNSQKRLTDGTGFIFIPVKDQLYYADSDTYYGSGRLFGVGSKVTGEKYDRIMKFLDWYASPEGAVVQHNGIEGFNYSVGADGKFTVMNDNALMDNLPVPEEYGGGGYSDGNNQINQWIVDASNINPNSGEPYSSQYWSSFKAESLKGTKEAWQAKFGASEPAEYMKNNGVLFVSPSVSVSLESDSAEIAVIRNQCNETLCNASWKMIFAKDAAEFDKMWDEMTTTMNGLGFEDLYNFDCKKHQVEVDAKIAAMQ